jgi:uncharacterized protein YdbL (DUF1318 family)
LASARSNHIVNPGEAEESTMRSIRSPAATLAYEIAQEKASALGRVGRQLEAALSALRAFDAAHEQAPAAIRKDRRQRDSLVAEAGQALWYLVVQRDACGMHDSTSLMTDYGVPIEVRNRMGPLRRQAVG